MVFVLYILRLVVVLLLLLPLCTKKTRRNIYVEKTRTRVVQKKCRKQRKAGKVQQVIDGGGVQVGACERPGRCQPSPLRKKNLK